MGKHRLVEPQGSTYGPAFPLLYLAALAAVETVALLNRGCFSLGVC